LPRGSRRSFPHYCLFLVRSFQDALCFRFRLAEEQLGLPFGLCSAVYPELLCGHQSLVHRSLTIAKNAKLFLRASKPLLVLSAVAQQTLQLIRYRQLELVHLPRVISPESTLEFLRPDIQGCEMEGVVVAHALRSPNSTVPSLIIVAPSSTASG
jgi:hypothetical protein